MTGALLIVVPLAGAIVVEAVVAKKASSCTCPLGGGACGSRERRRRERPDTWARMEEKMAEMPKTFPPR